MYRKYLKFLLLIILTVIGLWASLEFNQTYQLSMKARFYYALGDYNLSYELSDQALRLEEYNTMAFHLKNRSKASIEAIEFIKESEEFEIQIREILTKNNQTKGDVSKVKMMTDIIISRYENLNKAFVEDDSLLESAETQYLKFKKLNDEIKNAK